MSAMLFFQYPEFYLSSSKIVLKIEHLEKFGGPNKQPVWIIGDLL